MQFARQGDIRVTHNMASASASEGTGHGVASLAPVEFTINLKDPGKSKYKQSSTKHAVSSAQDQRNLVKNSVLTRYVRCTNQGCEWVGQQDELDNHSENECLLSVVSCYHKDIGCKKEVQRCQLSQHLHSHLQFHFKLACDKISKTAQELELVKKQSQEQKADFEFVMEELEMVQGQDDEQKKELAALKAQNQKEKQEVEILKAQNHELKVELEMIKAQHIEQKKEFELVVELNEKQSKRLDMVKAVAQTHELRRELGITQAHNSELKREIELVKDRLKEFVGPTIVWRISTFQQLANFQQDSKKMTVHSDTLYTGPHGYKVKVNLNINIAITDREPAHLSVNIIILKGEYDAILPWPLIKKFNFAILDQQESFGQRSNITCSFVPEIRSKCFQRPKTDANQASEDILMCNQERLEKGKYLVDGALFLQIDVTDINNN